MQHGLRRQRGVTFLGILFLGAVLAVSGVVLAQAVPTYIEYLAVKKAVKKASTGSTVAEVRDIFNKAAQIDDIRSLSGNDLEIGKEGERVVVRFSYDREIHLAGPAWLLMRYQGDSK